MNVTLLDLTDSVESIWLLWIVSSCMLGYLTIVAWNRMDWRQMRCLLRREDGGAYTLSYVMVVPIYILLICVVVETTLMLTVKIGTVYASFAGARTAIVWNTATDEADAAEKARQAAIRAFVPFASGMAEFRSPSGEDSDGEIDAFIAAYNDYVDELDAKPGSERYLRAKYRYAKRAVEVETEVQPVDGGEPWDEDIQVTVTYQFPFNVPPVGMMLGSKGPDGHYVYAIRSNSVLQNETPQNEEKQLGINYASGP